MKTELIDVSPTRKEIKIEIEPAEIRDAYDRISREYSKAAKVPGFRPGHAPTSVVRTRYKSEIRSEVLRELLPDAVNSAIDEHSLSAIGEPEVHLDNSEALDRLGDEPLTVKVGLEVLPQIELKEYKGLETTRRVRPITDVDIDRVIEGLRDSSASLQPVEDRSSQLGDTVTINARGRFVDDAPDAEEIKVDDVEVVLGGPGVQQEFTDNLTGVKPEETKTFLVEYPQDFTSPGLAGKKVEYSTDVTAVRQKELPELDDEWAQSLGGEFDTVETLRTKIREDLEGRAKAESEHHVRGELVKKLVAENKFEVPESLVEQQTNQRLQDAARQMMQRGIDPRSEQINWEGAREELRPQAEDDVRATMLMEKIAEAENITISNEEIEAEIESIASAARQTIEQVRAALTKNGGERSIAHRLRNRKALDLLVENARITDAEWTEPTDDQIEEDDAPENE
ncbi:MAG TPA: trigger factor [Pyrinomonadaceae bacterium]|nr:trigger factor [Pyrinomonadaceae bacterium]